MHLVCSSSSKSHFEELDRHMKYHQNEDRLSCPVCDKSFQFPSQLDYHQISRHNKPSNFLCEYCSEYFQRNCFKIIPLAIWFSYRHWLDVALIKLDGRPSTTWSPCCLQRNSDVNYMSF